MKKAVSLILAVFFAFGTLAFGAGSALALDSEPQKWTVPSGYNANDYNKLAAFLETADSSGVKNGQKCGTNYNPNDPATWGREGNTDDPENPVEPVTFTWTEQEGEQRITEITCHGADLVGALDVSGCAYLYSVNCATNRISSINLSQCARLTSLICSSNAISSLNTAACPELMTLTCDNNALTSINVAANPALRSLTVSGNAIGSLDLASNPEITVLSCKGCGLTSLNLSAQSKLLGLYCAENALTSLNLSANTRLQYVNCRSNALTQLNVSSCATILGINCDNNELASINLSANRLLVYFSCLNNNLTNLDLSATRLGFDSVTAQSGGTIACSASITSMGNENMPALDNSVHAYPAEGYSFTGWFGASGSQLSTEQHFVITGVSERSFTARFAQGSTPPAANGDVDGNGTVSVADAVLALRQSIGVYNLTPEQIARGDMDGNGSITVADAITILRMTMGL